MWGTTCGAIAAYKVRPFQKELERSYGIFRKQWMRYPIMAGAFSMAYYVGTQLPARLLRHTRKDGVTNDTYSSRYDLVGRFRLF